jgi:hypothetical protein
MKAKLFLTLTLGLAFVAAVIAAEQGATTGTETGSTATAVTTPPASQTSTNAEPTEREMRDAVQHHLDNFNSQMRPPAAPSTSSYNARPYVYSPYWHYYHYGYGYKNSQESNYENWTDVAKRAHNTAKVEITSFKKIKCTPEEGGFAGEYVAELELRGAANPGAQEIMQTSGKRLKGFFFKGDKGWIFGEAPSETK